MNPIQFNLPPGCEQSSCLCENMESDDLTQDVATIYLSGDVFIDVGWYPEHDPSGEYWIRVFRGDFFTQLIPPIKIKPSTAVNEVISTVESLATRFYNNTASTLMRC